MYFKGRFSISTSTLITRGERKLSLSISSHGQHNFKVLLEAMESYLFFMLQGHFQERFLQELRSFGCCFFPCVMSKEA